MIEMSNKKANIDLVHNAGRWRLVKRDTFSERSFDIYSFNENGWLVGAYRRDTTYIFGLDGRAQVLRYVSKGGRRFLRSRILGNEEIQTEVDRAYQRLYAWKATSEIKDIPDFLNFTPEQIGEHFGEIWGRIAILPPDQYSSAVVRLTHGCAYNGCRFCTFYKGVPYRVSTSEEFENHLDEVESFFGRELGERRGIFFADANAANAPMARLREAFQTIRARADRTLDWRYCLRGGIASFLDTFSRSERSVEEWRELRKAGLDSLYLGVESGSAELRRFWHKPGVGKDILALVERLKKADMRLGIIVLSGAENEFLVNKHNEQTAILLNSMPLDSKDKIYISEYQPEGNGSMSDDEYVEYRSKVRACTEDLQSKFNFARYPEGPVISLYDVWQFMYV